MGDQKQELTENQQRWMKNVDKVAGKTFAEVVQDFENEMEPLRREQAQQYRKNNR